MNSLSRPDENWQAPRIRPRTRQPVSPALGRSFHSLRPGFTILILSWCVAGFWAKSSAQNVTLAWNPSTDSSVTGYSLYYGGASGTYTNKTNTGSATNATVAGLMSGNTYFFAVTAYNSSGLESLPSAEVAYTVPSSAPTNPPLVILSSPQDGASYAAPASIGLAASVTSNGHTINAVQFYGGSILVGQANAAPYTFTWDNVPAGVYNLSALALYDSVNQSTSAPVTVSVTNVTVAALPPPWQTGDIGSGEAAGNAFASNGIYTVNGAGSLSRYADAFRFLYQDLTGNGSITARVNDAGTNGTRSRIGVMIRENLTSGSRYALLGVSSDGTYRWQRRNSTGGSTHGGTDGSGSFPNVWTRILRSGNTFTGYKSTNGTNWTQVFSSNITMATNSYIGFAVDSGASNVLATAVFSDVTVVP